VNIEVGFLRQIMRKHGTWARIAPDVRMLTERQDVGRALTADEESALLLECGRSRSRILLPFVVLSLETGARFNTVRCLQWSNIDFTNRCIQFGKDKTAAGTGRTIPLSQRAVDTMKMWALQFPDRKLSHYVFPAEEYGAAGADETFGFKASTVISTDPARPTGSIKTAWQAARARTRRHCPNCRTGTLVDQQKPKAGYYCIDCRLECEDLPRALITLRCHDLRHSAVSRMISARIPLPIIGKVVGWSPSTLARMSARYGHFQLDEMRSAVEAISRPTVPAVYEGSPQFPPQSGARGKASVN
jgi:integrase